MQEVNATYFWTPIEDIDFSLGVVVPVSHSKDELTSPSLSNGEFSRLSPRFAIKVLPI